MNKKKIKTLEQTPAIKKNPPDRYPVFCFKHLQQHSYHKCSDSSFFIVFLERLKKLGQLGWQGIHGSHRHSFGTEKIPIQNLKVNSFPPIITEDVTELTVFRATGNNLPFLGIRLDDIFQIIFIESAFGDIYPH